MSKKRLAAKWLNRVWGGAALDAIWGSHRLTVLAYHRIIEHAHAGFADYRPVVSATPDDFRQQMAYIKAHFNAITAEELDRALRDNGPLPPRPVLITFDDGYLDNYENAYPILREMSLSAVIFLATSRMDDPRPLWWDAVARAFHATDAHEAQLPLLGAVRWDDQTKLALLDGLLAALKRLPEGEKQGAVSEIQAALGYAPRDDAPLFVNWHQVRELVDNGIACQSHTVTHPIMTRIDARQVREELELSRKTLIEETRQSVTLFAYPNGTPADYDRDTIRAIQDVGYHAAFTLSAGPMRWGSVQRYPYQIRRVYLGYQDDFDVFKAKVMGLPAIGTRLAYR